MANPDDPDFSAFDALPDSGGGGTIAQKTEAAASGVSTAVARFGEKNKGSTVADAAAAASEITNAGRTLGMNIAIAEQAAKDLKAAKVAWEKAAAGAKKADLDKADQAVTDARADLATAQASEDEQRDKYNKAKEDQSAEGKLNAVALKSALDMATAETTKAQEKLTKAIETARKLHEQNRAACEALRAALQRVADALKKVNSTVLPGGKADVTSGGTGMDIPGAPGNGKDTGSTPASAGAPGNGAATTPAAPSAKAPGSTSGTTPETKTSSTTGDPATTAAVASLLGKGQQQPQTQQAQQMPTMPTMPQVQATQPQQQAKGDGKNDKHSLATDGILGEDDIAGLTGAGTGLALGLGGGSPVAESPSPAPAVQQPGTTFRPSGTPITGTTAGGTPVPSQPSPTTGTSVEGLNTRSDVSGRSEPAKTAFSATPAGAATTTSAATGGSGAGGQGAAQQGARGGMPAMPMMPHMGAVGAPAAAGGGQGGKERSPITAYRDEQMFYFHGGDTRGEAVPGGTIAQNRPGRDADSRRNAA